MKGIHHFYFYGLILIGMEIFNAFYNFAPTLIFIGSIGLYVINPDIDLLFKSRGAHRSLFTHSFILPLIIYIPIRAVIGENADYALLSLLFFLPVIAHLIGDFRPSTIIGAMAGDLKELVIDRDLRPGNQKTGGFWRITTRPAYNYTFTFYQTVAWIMGNILFMVGFILAQYFIF